MVCYWSCDWETCPQLEAEHAKISNADCEFSAPGQRCLIVYKVPVSVLTIDTFCGLCRAVPVSVLTIDTFCVLCQHGFDASQIAHGVSGGDLPRCQSWRPPGGYFQGRSGSRTISLHFGRGVSKDRVAGACLLRWYLKRADQRPGWLRVDRLLGEKGIGRDSAAGRREIARQMERRRREEDGADLESVRRGWCLGSEEFRQELLAAAVERVGASHSGADRRETGEQKAGGIVREELRRRGWKEEDLPVLRKGDPGKVALARRLRRETTMSLKWIARRLHIGQLDLCLQPVA